MADNRQYVQGQDFTLAGGGITSAATTIVVTSFKTPDGTNIVTADIGNKAYATMEPGTAKEENISFTTITQNGDGTADLSGVVRGLGFVDPYTTVAANQLAHAGGVLLRITNSAPFYADFANKENDETISQAWTFDTNNFPRMNESTTAPINDAFLATKKYVDDTAGGTPVSINRIVVDATAGEVVADGNVVFFDETDNEWKLADASAASTSENIQLGIAQGAGVDGGAITGGVLLIGRDNAQAGFAAGDPVFLTDVAGTLGNSAGTKSVQVGTAISATEIDFTPSYYKSVATADEKAAMAGNSGTPAAANLYITELGLQRSIETFAADAEASDTYVVTLDPVPAGYVAGMTLKISFNTANTGAATINVNGLGAQAITKNGASALDTNDILASQTSIIVYDGTRFQLQSIASTITAAEVATLTGGSTSDADALHTHDSILSFGASPDSATFNSFNATTSEDAWALVDVTFVEKANFVTIEASAATWEATSQIMGHGSDQQLQVDANKLIAVEFRARLFNGTAGDRHIGGIGTIGNFVDAFDAQNNNMVAFTANGATLFAHVSDGGAETTTDISAGITITNWNLYKIIWDQNANSVQFLVNGTLETTISTNVPSGAATVVFGSGGTTNTEDTDLSNIIISMEL